MQNNFQINRLKENMAPSAGFEHASQPWQGRILDRAILQGHKLI